MDKFVFSYRISGIVIATAIVGCALGILFKSMKPDPRLPTRFWVGDTMDVVQYVQGSPSTLSGPDAQGTCIWYFDRHGSVMFRPDKDGVERVTQWRVSHDECDLTTGPHSYKF